jgi:hypothetical protein
MTNLKFQGQGVNCATISGSPLTKMF